MSVTSIHECRKRVRLMGSDFEFVVAADEEVALQAIGEAIAEVKRIENLLTEFSDASQTSLINKNAGVNPVKVDREVYEILKRCKDISGFTQGAFDITAGVLKKLYNFKGRHFELPDKSVLNEALWKVGSDKIKLTVDNEVFLTGSGMRIGFGAIGKGYAADMARRKLMKMGIANGVINASGDLTAFGRRVDGELWRVGIADPDDTSRTIAWIPIDNASVATSGDYEQYFERDGIRYSHTIDPKTGHPVKGIKSVTIVSLSAELSDALATAVTIMGVDTGLHFIEQLPGVHCLIITDKNKIFTSKHLHFNLTKP